MPAVPTVSVIGSCRVYDPLKSLADAGLARLNQQRIFGFVHNSREVLQQLRLMTGEQQLPSRLRPFLNIPANWVWEPSGPETALAERFSDTDCFVVEISSIRLLRFKAMFLQINRTRELLVTNEAVEKRWWTPLLRGGRSEAVAYLIANRLAGIPPVHRELLEGMSCSEQTTADLIKDMRAIRDALPAPVLFVSHFNTNADGEPIPQRQVITDAMAEGSKRFSLSYFDPTRLMVEAGIADAMLDAAHYMPSFVPHVGAAMLQQIRPLIERPKPGEPVSDPLGALVLELEKEYVA